MTKAIFSDEVRMTTPDSKLSSTLVSGLGRRVFDDAVRCGAHRVGIHAG